MISYYIFQGFGYMLVHVKRWLALALPTVALCESKDPHSVPVDVKLGHLSAKNLKAAFK